MIDNKNIAQKMWTAVVDSQYKIIVVIDICMVKFSKLHLL